MGSSGGLPGSPARPQLRCSPPRRIRRGARTGWRCWCPSESASRSCWPSCPTCTASSATRGSATASSSSTKWITSGSQGSPSRSSGRVLQRIRAVMAGVMLSPELLILELRDGQRGGLLPSSLARIESWHRILYPQVFQLSPQCHRCAAANIWGLWKSKTGHGVFGNAVTCSSLCREKQGCCCRMECCVCLGQTSSTDGCGRGVCGNSGCCAWH